MTVLDSASTETSSGKLRSGSDNRLPLWRRVRFRISETKVRAPIVYYRHRDFRPADVFLASYPRSGSTWLRFMLYEMITGDPSTFGNVNSAFRVVGEHFGAAGLLPTQGRLIGTHEQYRPAYHKVLYLVRDVRDVVLSQFPREKEMGVAAKTFDDYLYQLMTGRKRHGSWHQHVLSYLDSDTATRGEFLLIKFEDMRRDTEQTFKRILDFLGMQIDRHVILHAIESNSLQSMRTKEDQLHSTTVRIPRHPHKGSHEEARFVRSGSVGSWREQLTAAQIALIQSFAGTALLRLGYPLCQATEDANPTSIY
jgi:hypothetical protein